MRSRRAGMTAIELAISSVLLIILSGALTTSLMHMRDVTSDGGIQAKLQDQGERAMSLIMSDLRRSGFVAIGAGGAGPGINYPYFFADGVTNATFAAHAHAPASKEAVAGDADFGPNNEIVLVQPAMATVASGDELPVLDAQGAITWSPNVVDYVVMTGADGTNYLERRVDAAEPRRIASHVERISFESNSTSPGAGIPNDAVRVRIFFRQRAANGALVRSSAEVTVHLRN
jgi:hypothetical protein